MTCAYLVGDNTFSPVLHMNMSRMSVIALFLFYHLVLGWPFVVDRTQNIQELMSLSFDHVSGDEGMV